MPYGLDKELKFLSNSRALLTFFTNVMVLTGLIKGINPFAMFSGLPCTKHKVSDHGACLKTFLPLSCPVESQKDSPALKTNG